MLAILVGLCLPAVLGLSFVFGVALMIEPLQVGVPMVLLLLWVWALEGMTGRARKGMA